MKSKKKKQVKTDPKVRSFFVLGFPTIFIVALPMMFEMNMSTAFMMISLAIYQFLMLKQFVDQYHEVL